MNPMIFKIGDRVRMSEELKRLYRGECGEAGHHVGPFDEDEGDDPGGECWGCSTHHVDEFGECIGIVEGPVEWEGPLSSPELNVRWLPDMLRYAYHPKYLVKVKD